MQDTISRIRTGYSDRSAINPTPYGVFTSVLVSPPELSAFARTKAGQAGGADSAVGMEEGDFIPEG
jgi:hypothetical protein